MQRLFQYTLILSAVILLSLASVAPVMAQAWTVPETVNDLQELADYQTHLTELQPPRSTAEAGMASGPMPWYIEFNEINDCCTLAHYQSHLADISVPPAKN